MNAFEWLTVIVIGAILIAVPILMVRTLISMFGPKRRKHFASAVVAVALLGLERFIRPAQEHVVEANDGEVDQDAIADGSGPREWVPLQKTVRPDEMVVEEEEKGKRKRC